MALTGSTAAQGTTRPGLGAQVGKGSHRPWSIQVPTCRRPESVGPRGWRLLTEGRQAAPGQGAAQGHSPWLPGAQFS